MTAKDWGTKTGILQGALANIINECELPTSREMPLLTLATIAAYCRDVLARTAPPAFVPTGTGWPVT